MNVPWPDTKACARCALCVDAIDIEAAFYRLEPRRVERTPDQVVAEITQHVPSQAVRVDALSGVLGEQSREAAWFKLLFELRWQVPPSPRLSAAEAEAQQRAMDRTFKRLRVRKLTASVDPRTVPDGRWERRRFNHCFPLVPWIRAVRGNARTDVDRERADTGYDEGAMAAGQQTPLPEDAVLAKEELDDLVAATALVERWAHLLPAGQASFVFYGLELLRTSEDPRAVRISDWADALGIEAGNATTQREQIRSFATRLAIDKDGEPSLISMFQKLHSGRALPEADAKFLESNLTRTLAFLSVQEAVTVGGFLTELPAQWLAKIERRNRLNGFGLNLNETTRADLAELLPTARDFGVVVASLFA